MVRLRAKIEIEPNSLAIRSTRKVPTIASAADQQRQERGDQAAEEEQREQEEEREGEHLGHPQVLLDLLVDLLLGERGAADRDAGLAGEVVRDRLGARPALLVVGRLERDREVGGVAVAGDEVAGVRCRSSR